MLMARETSTLKKGAGSLSYRMLMGDDGKGLAGIYRYIMFLLIELRDSAFQKGRGYICSRTMGDRAKKTP